VKPNITIRKALLDRALLGGVLGGETWRTWRTLLIAAMAKLWTTASARCSSN
jgi:hypothetical protein